MEEKMSKQELETMGNRQVNITYILCGCLESSFDDMEKLLEFNRQGLRFNNKRLMNELVSLSKRFRHLIDELQKQSILTLSDGTIYSHDVSIDIFYSMMMKFIMLTGVDDKYDFRAYSIWRILDQYQNQIDFPKRFIRDHMAWSYIEKEIGRGALSVDDMKTLLQKKIQECSDEDSVKRD